MSYTLIDEIPSGPTTLPVIYKFLISIISPIAPGDTEIPMFTENIRKSSISWEEYIADAADRPLNHIGTSEGITKAALILASEDSSFVTGVILAVSRLARPWMLMFPS